MPRPLWVFLAVCEVALVAGCGRPLTSSADLSPSPSPDTSQSPTLTTPSPSPSDPTAGWQTFSNPSLGYSLKLPPTVRHQGSAGGPDPGDWFSNEDVGSPEFLDASGIFIDIAVNGNSGSQCLQHGLQNATIEQASAITVDGTATNLTVVTWNATPGIVVNASHGGFCYEIVFIAGSKDVRDSYISTAQTMLTQTFTFGAGPQPTPTA